MFEFVKIPTLTSCSPDSWRFGAAVVSDALVRIERVLPLVRHHSPELFDDGLAAKSC